MNRATSEPVLVEFQNLGTLNPDQKLNQGNPVLKTGKFLL